MEDQPLSYPLGRGSPLDKLCRDGGKVLLLGAPLETITLFHHAECLADLPGKPVVRYSAPVLRGARRERVEMEEFDTNTPIGPWEGPEQYYFTAIAKDVPWAGIGTTGAVGEAVSYLFDAERLAASGRLPP